MLDHTKTPPRKKLAIISSYNESCGNASYTHVLKLAFSEYLDVDVLALDGFLLQSDAPSFRRLGNEFISKMCEKLKQYDYVNIQFEAGLYGSKREDALTRIKMLIDAAPNVIITMHRFDVARMSRGRSLFWSAWRFSFMPLLEEWATRRWEEFYLQIAKHIAKSSKTKNAWIAVHTRRERRIVRELGGCEKVFDYPITFLSPDERSKLHHSDGRAEFRARHGIPDGVKVIGAFGFISQYKSYETLVKALRELPPEYHLYMFGGQHPGSIRSNMAIDDYLNNIIKLVREETNQYTKELARKFAALRGRPIDESEIRDLLDYDLMRRIKFVGELADPEFLQALRFCDAVVLPYLEVGQSMSGVIALSLECGANLFCANNLSFAEARKYYGDVFTRFDIGNFVELAQKLQAPPADYSENREVAYNKYNLHKNVISQLEYFGFEADALAGAKV